MAVSITSISKADGLTHGGVFVELTGSGFFVPASQITENHKEPPSVQVSFGPFISKKAFSVSSTKAFAVVPKYSSAAINTLPDLVDVTVTNYDSNGDLTIDSDTLVDAFTFKRPVMNAESTLTTIVRKLIISLMNQVTSNVYWNSDQDYDEMVLDGFTFAPKKPAFVMLAPSFPENRSYFFSSDCQSGEGSGVDIYFGKSPRVVDMVWNFIGVADNSIQSLNMINSVYAYFDANKHLEINSDLKYEMELELPGISEQTVPNSSNTHHFTGTFKVTGIHVTQTIGEPGIEAAQDVFRAVQSVVKEVEEIDLNVTKKV